MKTCLDCGKRLPLSPFDTYTVECRTSDEAAPAVPAPKDGFRFRKWHRVYWTGSFEARTWVHRAHYVAMEPRRGVRGEGLFCSITCGFNYAVKAVRNAGA